MSRVVAVTFPCHRYTLGACLNILAECGYHLSFPTFTSEGRRFVVRSGAPVKKEYASGGLILELGHAQ